ncbi:ATP-binding protein [Marinilabiliaceae bacterium JC017]|nr:ATP-binding protein [Marinilabiliaceae bacterium JC017]
MKDLSMHILDIAQNSVRAKASLVQINIVERGEIFRIEVIDDGCGMSEETLKKVTDPFFTSRTTRKVGLGIPLIKQNAEQTGGFVKLDSKVGEGTRFKAEFGRYHIDRPPIGDLPGTMALLISGNTGLDFVFTYTNEQKSYSLDSREVKEILGDVDIRTPRVVSFLQEMINDNLIEIGVEF